MKSPKPLFSVRRTLAALAALLALAGCGAWFYQSQERAVREAAFEKLTLIGRLKTAEIAAWRRNLLADAVVYAEGSFLMSGAAAYFREPTEANAAPLRERFRSLQKHRGYTDVLLFDAAGEIRLSLSGKTGHHKGHADALAAALAQRRPALTDLYTDTPGGSPHIGAIAPLRPTVAGDPPPGAILLASDASQYLFPKLRSWPAPSRSAETTLSRRDGDAVVFLNPLRHLSDTALRHRIPLSRTDVPAVMAALGHWGVVEGPDYRGVPVVSYIQPIPGSPWFMVAKQDAAEIFADWRLRSRLILLLLAALAVCVVAVGAGAWYRRQKAHFRELYAAESALRASAERNSITLRSIGDAVIVTDAEGRVELLNPVAAALTGWREEEARGRPLEDVFAIVNEETRAPVANPVGKVLRQGTIVGLANHTVLIARNGTEIPIADSAAPVRDADGRIVGVVLVFHDQTLQQNYATLFRRMLSGFAVHEILCDEKGEPVDYRFIDVNPAFEEMTGLSRAAIVGKTVREVLPGTERHWIETYGRVALTGESVRFTNYSQEIDKYFFVSAFRSAPRRFATIFQDVTEHRRAEAAREEMRAQLLQAQKVESVGRLAGGVAHDFNNMLSVILGNAELALETLAPDASQRNELQEIMKAGKRAADVTRQLLTFARKQIISPRVLDLNETVEGMLKMLRSLIGENIDLAWAPGSGIRPIKIDPSQVNQVLANLCLNARDAIDDVGRITIETAMETLDEEYCAAHADFIPGTYVRLTVSDNGCGMSSETLAHLFEPFFTTKPVGRGTGLGLATIHGIVKQNNGFVTVYSEPGHGSTFKIYLPPHAGACETDGAAPRAVAPKGGGEVVLVVEDDLAILGLAGVMLETLGYAVLIAQAPDEALKIAAAHQGVIDLVITDVVMPVMNGRELARRLAEMWPGIKILFMSGYTADVIAQHGVLEKGVAFMQKPFSKQDLALHVRRALDQ